MHGKINLLDDSLAQPLVDDFTLLGHGKDSRERQTFDTRVETARLFTNGGRKHRDGALHEIHAVCPLASIAVKSSVRLDEVRNVSDVHSHIISPIVVGLNGQCIIKVLCSLGIDSKDTLFPKIPPNLNLPLWDTVNDIISPYLGRSNRELTSRA